MPLLTKKIELFENHGRECMQAAGRNNDPKRRKMLLKLARDHQPHFGCATDAALEQRRIEARDGMIRRLTDAWKSPRDQAPGNDPAARMRRHLEPDEPDADDAQARRDAIWNDYKTRLGNAWRTTIIGPGPAAVGADPTIVGPGLTRGGR